MTAASTNRATARFGTSPIFAVYTLLVAAATNIYAGTMVARNQAGTAVPASADPTLVVVGVSEAQADNSASGTVYVKYRVGPHPFFNSSSTDALTVADIGSVCFAVDDQTVSRTSNGGARPMAGIVRGFDGTQVIVEVGVDTSRNNDELFIAGEDLSTHQFKFIKLDTSGNVVRCGAGEFAIGLIQNAPASGAVAIVRSYGTSKYKSDATGNTAGDMISVASGGVGRTSSDASTKLAHTNTNDAGSTTDALLGARQIVGVARATVAANGTGYIHLTLSGSVATTAS